VERIHVKILIENKVDISPIAPFAFVHPFLLLFPNGKKWIKILSLYQFFNSFASLLANYWQK
jgi:hypothetical protein